MKCFGSKCVLTLAILFCSASSWALTQYPNLDDSTQADDGVVGWGSCVQCAGGASDNASIASSPFQTTPSRDGASRDFYINGAAYSNGLWWYKVGPNNAASTFTFDFWLNVALNTQAAQALEFDVFQFISGREYMFGTQCDYASGTWDLWNAGYMTTGGLPWVHSNVPCKKFVANTWYHITLKLHRTSPNMYVHYDSLTVIQYNVAGKIVTNSVYGLNRAYPSQPTPPGWGDDLGVQFQMDMGPKGSQMQEWVDQVSLAAY